MQSTQIEYDCPICLLLMAEPVELKCKHTFCFHCLSNLEDFSMLKFKCPMCRCEYPTSTDLQINKQMQKKIESQDPVKFQQRLAQVKIEQEQQNQKIQLKLIYGNEHQYVPGPTSNTHRWKMFVDIQRKGLLAKKFQNAGDIIEKVEYKLHPTFNPSTIVCDKYPFTFSRIGWGVFNIPIKVYFKQELDQRPLQLNHMLSFSGQGESSVHFIELKNEQSNNEKQQA